MEGYETILIGNFYAFPAFQRKDGEFLSASDSTGSGYQFNPAWRPVLGTPLGPERTRSGTSSLAPPPAQAYPGANQGPHSHSSGRLTQAQVRTAGEQVWERNWHLVRSVWRLYIGLSKSGTSVKTW